MKKTMLVTLAPLMLGFLGLASSHAAFAGQQFSAEVVQQGPDGILSSGKMFKGAGRARTEMSHQGQQVVRIVDEKRGVEWVLFPEQKKYMERQLGAPGGQAPAAKPSAEDPCAGLQGITCRKIGEEPVGGRVAVKWEMVGSQQGKTVTVTQWIDKERGPAFLLRQEMSGGPKMERHSLGTETLDGRTVEKWKVVMTQPGGQAVETIEWYDPQLELAVKQEFPGGMVSELRSVRIGEQPDHLFGIPAGYERVTMPAGMSGQQPPKP